MGVVPVLLITGKRKDRETLYAGQVFKGKTIDRIESVGNYTLTSVYMHNILEKAYFSFNFDFRRGWRAFSQPTAEIKNTRDLLVVVTTLFFFKKTHNFALSLYVRLTFNII